MVIVCCAFIKHNLLRNKTEKTQQKNSKKKTQLHTPFLLPSTPLPTNPNPFFCGWPYTKHSALFHSFFAPFQTVIYIYKLNVCSKSRFFQFQKEFATAVSEFKIWLLFKL